MSRGVTDVKEHMNSKIAANETQQAENGKELVDFFVTDAEKKEVKKENIINL